jgi:hypothetical protein
VFRGETAGGLKVGEWVRVKEPVDQRSKPSTRHAGSQRQDAVAGSRFRRRRGCARPTGCPDPIETLVGAAQVDLASSGQADQVLFWLDLNAAPKPDQFDQRRDNLQHHEPDHTIPLPGGKTHDSFYQLVRA